MYQKNEAHIQNAVHMRHRNICRRYIHLCFGSFQKRKTVTRGEFRWAVLVRHTTHNIQQDSTNAHTRARSAAWSDIAIYTVRASNQIRCCDEHSLCTSLRTSKVLVWSFDPHTGCLISWKLWNQKSDFVVSLKHELVPSISHSPFSDLIVCALLNTVDFRVSHPPPPHPPKYTYEQQNAYFGRWMEILGFDLVRRFDIEWAFSFFSIDSTTYTSGRWLLFVSSRVLHTMCATSPRLFGTLMPHFFCFSSY